MGACDLPNMHALGPQASGIHIRQIPHAHMCVVTTILHIFHVHTHSHKTFIGKKMINDIGNC